MSTRPILCTMLAVVTACCGLLSAASVASGSGHSAKNSPRLLLRADYGAGPGMSPKFIVKASQSPWVVKWTRTNCPSDTGIGASIVNDLGITAQRNQTDQGSQLNSNDPGTASSGVTPRFSGTGKWELSVETNCAWSVTVLSAKFVHRSKTSPTATTAPLTNAVSPPPTTTASSGGVMKLGGPERMYSVGQIGTLYDVTEDVNLATIFVRAPTFSTSDSGGDSPQYGYFASFTVTVADIAPTSSKDTISPSDVDFFVQTSNGTRYGDGVQSNLQEGNSMEATGVNELGTNSVGGSVTLSPGQSTTGTVVIDVPSQHGSLVFSGAGQIDGAWSY